MKLINEGEEIKAVVKDLSFEMDEISEMVQMNTGGKFESSELLAARAFMNSNNRNNEIKSPGSIVNASSTNRRKFGKGFVHLEQEDNNFVEMNSESLVENNLNRKHKLELESVEHIDADHIRCCCSGQKLFDCISCLSETSTMRLGKGAFASVYRARWLGSTVAVKQYSNSTEDPSQPNQHEQRKNNIASKAFYQELRALHGLRHPNMIRFFGASLQQRALVMEVAEGGCLTTYIQENQKKPFCYKVWPEHLRIASECSCGLLYLHLHDIVHGDMKR